MSLRKIFDKFKNRLIIALMSALAITALAPSICAKAEESYAEAWEDSAMPAAGKPGERIIWYTTKPKIKSGYLGQAVLVYLMDRNTGGAVAGTQPYLLNCTIPQSLADDPNFRSHCVIRAQDKRNLYSPVTSFYRESVPWASAAPSQRGGILTGSSRGSNIENIKTWLVAKAADGVPNVVRLVETLWGTPKGIEFAGTSSTADDGKYLLVMEPVLAIKPLYCGISLSDTTSLPGSGYADITALKNAIRDVSSNAVYPEHLTGCKMYLQKFIDTYEQLMTGSGSSNTHDTILSQESYDFARNLLADFPSSMITYGTWNGSYRDFWWRDLKNFVLHSSINLYTGAKLWGDSNKNTIIGTSKSIIDTYVSHMEPQADFATKKYFSGSAFVFKHAQRSAYVNTNSTLWPASVRGCLWPAGVNTSRTHTSEDIYDKTIGMMISAAYRKDGGGSSNQSTCDEPLIPTEHKAPEESTTGTVTIVKSYRKINSSTGAQEDKGTFLKFNSTNEISIEDELQADGTGYKLVAWRVSSMQYYHPSNKYAGLPINWETKVGTYSLNGDSPEVVNVGNNLKLYLLLEYAEDTVSADLNARVPQSWITKSVSFNQDNPGNNYLSGSIFRWKIPAHDTTPCGGHDCHYTCSNINTCDHKIEDSTHECICTGTMSCPHCHKTITAGSSCPYCGAAHGNPIHHTAACLNHKTYHCGGHSHTVYCTNTNHSLVDAVFGVGLKGDVENKETNKNILAYLESGNYLYSGSGLYSKSVTRPGTDEYEYTASGVDFAAVVHRGDRAVTISNWNNSSMTTGFFNTLYKNNSSKYKVSDTYTPGSNTGYVTGNYSKVFKWSITDERQADTTTDFGGSAHCGSHNANFEHHNYQGVNTAKIDVNDGTGTHVDQDKIDGKVNVTVEYYESKSQITNSTALNLAAPGGGFIINRFVVGTGFGQSAQVATIKTVPYVQMQYSSAIGGGGIGVNVLGNYQREIPLYAFSCVYTDKANPSTPNLTMNSLQWSTHQRAGANHPSNTVLPGGASFTISLEASKRPKVVVETIQPVIKEDSAGGIQIKNTVGDAGFDNVYRQVSKAKDGHNAAKDTVKASLEGMTLEQWILGEDKSTNTNINTRANSKDVITSGTKVDKNLSVTINGSTFTTSGDSKYYFNNTSDLKDASRGNIDVKENTTFSTMTIWCDTSGNIYINSGETKNTSGAKLVYYRTGQTADGVVAVGSYDYTSSTLNKQAKTINDYTHIIDILVRNLQKGGGDDSTATWCNNYDGHWYNEAFDGITYVWGTTEFSVGLVYPGERISILDPKLTPSKSGIAQDYSVFYTSQFKTSKLIDDKAGQFKYGSTNIDLFLKDSDMVLWSREFYIPNATVQDIK